MPKPKVYGVDLDGVCFDFLGGFASWLKVNYSIDVQPHNLTNYYWTGFDTELKDKIWKIYFHEFCREGGLLGLSAIPGAAEGINTLIDGGNTIHFITSREDYVLEDTIQSITTKLGVESPSVHIAKGHVKTPYVKSLLVDIFIDDAPHTLTEVAINTRATVYCMDHPYNREIDETFIIRVHNWQEFLEAEGWINA